MYDRAAASASITPTELYIYSVCKSFLAVIFSLGIACIMCNSLDSTSDTKWPSHYTIHHRKLSNAGLVSAVGIVLEPHVRFPGSNTLFHQLPVTDGNDAH